MTLTFRETTPCKLHPRSFVRICIDSGKQITGFVMNISNGVMKLSAFKASPDCDIPVHYFIAIPLNEIQNIETAGII